MAEERWKVEGWVPRYTDPDSDPTWSMTIVGQEAALTYLRDAVRDDPDTTVFRFSRVDEVTRAATPTRLATDLPGRQLAADARDRLARHLYFQSIGENQRYLAEWEWDHRPDAILGRGVVYAQADAILAVITDAG